MSTKANRRKKKKQNQARKRRNRELQKQQFRPPSEPAVGSSRFLVQAMQRLPEAWPGETPEDVAVFDDTALQKLDADLREQVLAVRSALQSATGGAGEDALKLVSGISRRSPISQWRLFLRGLVPWLEGHPDVAAEAWQRLDLQRRPGRIAVAMMNSLPNKAESEVTTEVQTDDAAAKETWFKSTDDQLIHQAELLRRQRFDRKAIKIAETGLQTPEKSSDMLLGPSKVTWLKRFVDEYRTAEPELTDALKRTALLRAFHQPYVNVFTEVTSIFEGPAHDPNNRWLAFLYFGSFKDSDVREVNRNYEQYLETDLPNNEKIPKQLRAAIISQIHLQAASAYVETEARNRYLSFGLEDDLDGQDTIRTHLRKAIEAYPMHREAYETYCEWIEQELDDSYLTKKEREPWLREQADVMTRWSQALPDDSKPHLWLLDYLLENEETEKAKVHVEWLTASRHDDPHVRAAPWKWQLLEAMRLCRRKTWLKDVPARLEEAARLWPTWLSQQWLPYLKAAVALRACDTEDFERQRDQICRDSGVKRDSLLDACMMLGAAQRMRVPSSDLKPLRVPVDEAVKKLVALPDEELISVAGFFWDLHRADFAYPAYRMHGGKFVEELDDRLRVKPTLVTKNLDDKAIHAAVLLCSHHRCFATGYDLRLPMWYEREDVRQHPIFTAARVNALLTMTGFTTVSRNKDLVEQLRGMAETERDPYYRHWFQSLAQELEDKIAKRPSFKFGFDFFDDDEYDSDDMYDEELDFDPNCDCEHCTATRRAYEESQR